LFLNLRKGKEGGERGLEAVSFVFLFEETAGISSEGEERKKYMKPKKSRPARTKVKGFVRRNERGVGILETMMEANRRLPVV
jgi:hypothetical protein